MFLRENVCTHVDLHSAIVAKGALHMFPSQVSRRTTLFLISIIEMILCSHIKLYAGVHSYIKLHRVSIACPTFISRVRFAVWHLNGPCPRPALHSSVLSWTFMIQPVHHVHYSCFDGTIRLRLPHSNCVCRFHSLPVLP